MLGALSWRKKTISVIFFFKMPGTNSNEILISYELHIVDSAAFTSHSESKKLLDSTVCTFYKFL